MLEVKRRDKQKRELEEWERSDRLKSQKAELISEEHEQSDRLKLQEAKLKHQEWELRMKRLELELVKTRRDQKGSPASSTGEGKSFKMKNLVQPFKIGENIGLFLVSFEHSCEKVGFTRQTWPQRLLTLLPHTAADVFARLTKDEVEDYEKVKASLLRKYCLSAEAIRQHFRSAEKMPNETLPEFAYNLTENLVEWLKGVDAHGNNDEVGECIFLEQFLRRPPEETHFWDQDKPDAGTVQRARELAEEFATHQALSPIHMVGSCLQIRSLDVGHRS